MKKILVVFAVAVFASCSSTTETYDTQDTLRAADSISSAKSTAVDSAASMQKSTIDSMQRESSSTDSTTKKLPR